MSGRGDLLRQVMRESRTTQSVLANISGVRQPSISQFLSGKVDMSDDQLDRLLSCMGYRLEVTRRPVVPELSRSERRSWRLHRQLSSHLTQSSLEEWYPTIERNLQRLRGSVTGQPHHRNLDRWDSLIEHRDVLGLHRVLTGLDRDSIEMREVSPMGGLLSQSERKPFSKGTLMRRDQLEHAIRTACQIIGKPEVIVVGSQAILGTFREGQFLAEVALSSGTMTA